jgi:hypothetical protein
MARKGGRSPAFKFKAELDKWYQANVSPTGGGLEWCRQVALDLLGEIIDRSPRKSGRFVANWQVGIGSPASGFRWQMRDPEGSQALRSGLVALQSMRELQTIYLTNNAPYALKLERGSSKQAPYGMVAISLEAVGQRYSVAGAGLAQYQATGRYRGQGGLARVDLQRRRSA